jgi:hypothetical protein
VIAPPSRSAAVVLRSAASLYLLFVISIAGTVTNWFRYSPSLEATFVLIVTTLGSVAVLIVWIRCWHSERSWKRVAVVIAVTIGAAGLSFWAQRHAYGTAAPARLQHIERNEVQDVRTGSRVLQYHLELINPYSEARAVLVIRDGVVEKRIDVPLFDRGVASLVQPDQPSDWIVLHPTSSDEILELRTSSYLREARFVIDLKRASAAEVR